MWKIDCKLACIRYKSDGDCNILCIIEMKSIFRQPFYAHLSCYGREIWQMLRILCTCTQLTLQAPLITLYAIRRWCKWIPWHLCERSTTYPPTFYIFWRKKNPNEVRPRNEAHLVGRSLLIIVSFSFCLLLSVLCKNARSNRKEKSAMYPWTFKKKLEHGIGKWIFFVYFTYFNC